MGEESGLAQVPSGNTSSPFALTLASHPDLVVVVFASAGCSTAVEDVYQPGGAAEYDLNAGSATAVSFANQCPGANYAAIAAAFPSKLQPRHRFGVPERAKRGEAHKPPPPAPT